MASWSKKSLGNRWLRLLQTLRCLLGVSPSPLSKKLHRHLHLTWSIMLLAWVWFVCTNLLLAKSQLQVLAIEKLLYLIEYPSNMIITALFSLRVFRSAEFFRQQSLQQKNLTSLLFEDAQKYFGQLGDYVRKLLLMVFSFHGLCVAIDICWLRFDWVQTLYSNCAHNLVGLMISLSLLQYVLDLRIIQQLHLQLNKQLKKITNRNPLKGIWIVSPEFDKLEWRLEQLRLTSITLDEMHVKLLDRFGLVLLVNFVNSLLSFCYELFNVFRILEQAKWSEDSVLFLYRLLWLLMHGSRIWSVLIANARIAEQKCQLCLLLNKLETDDTHLERTVNRFLLQLQASGGNTSMSTICGVVDLDTLALGGFISALSAIVIFLIQIDLGNKSLMGYSF